MSEDKEITIAELVTKTFDEVYPEDPQNRDLGKYVWSCNSRYSKYRIPRHCFGFYDWFCKDFSLRSKAKRLFGMVKSISKSKKFDPTKTYVFFKNNCPLNGPLYDDFRICDIESGEVIFNITPRSGHTGKCEIYGKENGFEKPLCEADTWSEAKKWFFGKFETEDTNN